MKKENKTNINNIKKVEKYIDNRKILPEDELNKINKKIFENIIIADIVMLFLFLIGMGALNIDPNIFVTDLRVFSIGLIVFTIFLFEISYKKENTNLCIHGIEALFISLLILFSIYVYILYCSRFELYIALFSYLFALYYAGKSIYIYIKMVKNYYASLSDINQIVKTRRKNKK